MSLLAAFFATLGLVVPVWAGGALPADDEVSPLTDKAKADDAAVGISIPTALQPAQQVKDGLVFRQVRIERRVIIRISPQPAPARRSMMASLQPSEAPRSRIVERAIGDCLPMSSIAGSNPQDSNRLLFFLRDRRVVAATLERKCSAADFYAGFYVERSEDGQICVDRDRLHSRGGSKCELSELNQLVRVAG